MAWFLNRYRCDHCGTKWDDEWSCMCNDECPTCGDDQSPFESDDLTIVLEAENGNHVVRVSPPSAEAKPDYVNTAFPTMADAQRFIESESNRLDALESAPMPSDGDPAASDPTTPLDGVLLPRALVDELTRFIGKAQGVCLGVAMSGSEHPNPDGALIEIFEDGQIVAEALRAAVNAGKEIAA